MSAGAYNILAEQGATYAQTFTYRDTTDALVNLTGYTARMQVRENYAAEEITLLKSLIAKAYTPLVVGQAYAVLEADGAGLMMVRRVVLFVAFTLAGVAMALLLGGCAQEPRLLKGSGIEAPAPTAYLKLCATRPALCAFDDLRRINAEINAYPYESEVDDDWTPITEAGRGDCDSYATAKFQRLLWAGWSPRLMRFAVVLAENGRGHLVLLVDLDGQTWVLDNRRPHPSEFDLLHYTWLRIQRAGTRQWEIA